MLCEALFIGDELTAAGFRLAGIKTLTPEIDELIETLDEACKQTQLILITAEYIETIDKPKQEEYLMRVTPMMLVVADINNRKPLANIADQVRRSLGILK